MIHQQKDLDLSFNLTPCKRSWHYPEDSTPSRCESIFYGGLFTKRCGPFRAFSFRRHIDGTKFWITCKWLKKRWSLTTNSKFSAIYHSVTSMWHPNCVLILTHREKVKKDFLHSFFSRLLYKNKQVRSSRLKSHYWCLDSSGRVVTMNLIQATVCSIHIISNSYSTY